VTLKNDCSHGTAFHSALSSLLNMVQCQTIVQLRLLTSGVTYT